MKMEESRQAQLIAALIDRKIEARFASLDAAVRRLSKEVERLKPARIRKLEAEVKEIRELLEDFNVKSLEEDIFREFNELNRKITGSLEKQRKTLDSSGVEIGSLRKRLEEARKMESATPENLARDIESLKAKSQWLERELDKTDTRLLLERIEMLEKRLDNLRVSNPMIIE